MQIGMGRIHGLGQTCDPSDLDCLMNQLPVQSSSSLNVSQAELNSQLSAGAATASSPSTWVIVALVAAGALLFMGAGKR